MIIDNITLPNFDWVDEFDWCSVRQSQNFSVNGALFIQESILQKGRTLTFAGSENMNLITRTQLSLLKSSQNTLNKTFTITLVDERVFTVRWRNSEGSAIEVVPFISHGFNSLNLYTVNALKFVEV